MVESFCFCFIFCFVFLPRFLAQPVGPGQLSQKFDSMLCFALAGA